MYVCMYIYIYRERERDIIVIGGFDSSRILILTGELIISKGDFPEIMSQRILVGIIVAGRLGVSLS